MTRRFQIESRVGNDGVLALRVPLSPSDANTEVIVTIQPKSPLSHQTSTSSWPPGYFDKTYGCLANDPLTAPEDPVPMPEDLA
jgi:hypothetical protein